MPVQAYDIGPQISHIKSFSDSLDRFELMGSKERRDKGYKNIMLDFHRARNAFNLIDNNLDKVPKADQTKALAAKISVLYSIEKLVKYVANEVSLTEETKKAAKEAYETWTKLAPKTKDPNGNVISSISNLPKTYKWNVEGRHTDKEMSSAMAGSMGPGIAIKGAGAVIKASKVAVDVVKSEKFMEKVGEVCKMLKLKYNLSMKPWKLFSAAEKQTAAEEVTEFARRNTGKGPEELWKVFENSLKDPIPVLRELTHANSVNMESLAVKHGEDLVMITKESIINSRLMRTPQEWAKAVDAISGTTGGIKGAVASKNLGNQLVIQYDNLVLHCFRKSDVMAGIAKDAPYMVERIEYSAGPLAGMFRPW